MKYILLITTVFFSHSALAGDCIFYSFQKGQNKPTLLARVDQTKSTEIPIYDDNNFFVSFLIS